MHDAGGLWTWEMLKIAPYRINALVLLNTIIYEDGFQPPVRMKKGAFGKFSMWLYTKRMSRSILLKQLFKKGLIEGDLENNDIEGYAVPLSEGKTKGMYYFFSRTCNALPDYNSVISNVQVPVAVIWGKHDDMLTWVSQEEAVIRALKIKEQDIHLINAKHFIQEEDPKAINTLILDFLKRSRSAVAEEDKSIGWH